MKKITLFFLLTILYAAGVYAQPANDDCSGAIDILNITGSCSTSEILVDLDNTATPSAGDPGCNFAGGDLWYKLVMPASGAVRIETSSGTLDDNGMAIYTGACGALDFYACNDDAYLNGDDLMAAYEVVRPASETIYIRLWGYGGATGTFNICAVAFTPPPAATNDICADATEIIPDVSCSDIKLGSNNATDSGVAAPGCPEPDSYGGRDVWYKFVVPNTGNFSVETSVDDGSITDTMMSIYTGSCAGLTELSCDDDNGVGAFSLIQATDISGNYSIGETLYVRVWSFANLELGTFNICVAELPSLSTEEAFADTFKLFPNPARDVVNLKFTQSSGSKVAIAIYNLQGKLVQAASKTPGNQNVSLPIAHLATGMYFVKLNDGANEVTKKLMVR
ncbi:T9SS type A sorting domain-containing protein [Aestuariivivens sediminicola]|uniref:T9SS type A sorting domain-containing protein n=1 Tax=Aestuariivivens sediminicola TaxID=2913560 RepID=UPI001F5A84A3|nr:T9SS type A sorting domain-containing protein [Aestuariivivens sediminicola]